MPNYIDNLLHKLGHTPPKKYNDVPYPYTQPAYGQKQQFAKPTDTSPKLNAQETVKIQSTIGSLLYYCRALDMTIHPALNELSTQQYAPMEHMKQVVSKLLDYMYTYPEAIIRYMSIQMQLFLFFQKHAVVIQAIFIYHLHLHQQKHQILSSMDPSLSIAKQLIMWSHQQQRQK